MNILQLPDTVLRSLHPSSHCAHFKGEGSEGLQSYRLAQGHTALQQIRTQRLWLQSPNSYAQYCNSLYSALVSWREKQGLHSKTGFHWNECQEQPLMVCTFD